MAARSILDAITKYQSDSYIKPFKNFSLDNLKNQFKNVSEAPRAIYNNFTNKIPSPSQEKEYVDTNMTSSPVMTMKGYTPTEASNRVAAGIAQTREPIGAKNFIDSLNKREELKLKNESKHLLSLAAVKRLETL
jgi:hypothetical protein